MLSNLNFATHCSALQSPEASLRQPPPNTMVQKLIIYHLKYNFILPNINYHIFVTKENELYNISNLIITLTLLIKYIVVFV